MPTDEVGFLPISRRPTRLPTRRPTHKPVIDHPIFTKSSKSKSSKVTKASKSTKQAKVFAKSSKSAYLFAKSSKKAWRTPEESVTYLNSGPGFTVIGLRDAQSGSSMNEVKSWSLILAVVVAGVSSIVL